MNENEINETAINPEDVALAVTDRKYDIEAALTQNTASYCSLKPTTPEASMALFNGLNSPKFKLADEIGKTIVVKDVFVELVDLAVKDDAGKPTGELTQAARIVLFDADGAGHQAISIGIFKSLERLFKVYGKPTWPNGIKLTVKQVNTAPTRKMLTLEVSK
jgi:hypothetical protein